MGKNTVGTVDTVDNRPDESSKGLLSVVGMLSVSVVPSIIPSTENHLPEVENGDYDGTNGIDGISGTLESAPAPKKSPGIPLMGGKHLP